MIAPIPGRGFGPEGRVRLVVTRGYRVRKVWVPDSASSASWTAEAAESEGWTPQSPANGSWET